MKKNILSLGVLFCVILAALVYSTGWPAGHENIAHLYLLWGVLSLVVAATAIIHASMIWWRHRGEPNGHGVVIVYLVSVALILAGGGLLRLAWVPWYFMVHFERGVRAAQYVERTDVWLFILVASAIGITGALATLAVFTGSPWRTIVAAAVCLAVAGIVAAGIVAVI